MDPILIVDDEKDNLDALKRMLRGQYEVSIAESPFEALKLIQNRLFHVIVSDQRMPEMTGVEFLEKAQKLTPLSTRILLTGYTDVEAVIDAINRGQIYRYVSKPWEPDEFRMTLKQANEAFVLKRELQEKNRSLERALSDLTLLDKAKARFLSLVSHELNTPLTVINSFIELLSQGKKELPGDVQKAVTLIQGASEQLTEIVRDIVEYVRLESNPGLNIQPADLSSILNEIFSELKLKTAQQNIQMKLETSSSLSASVDFEKVKSALRQLALDSLKRSPAGSQIEWALSRQGSRVLIEVRRDGEPMSEEALNAFETGQSHMHHQRNLGMGLAFCRTIIERHGGTMRTEAKGSKTALILEFPDRA